MILPSGITTRPNLSLFVHPGFPVIFIHGCVYASSPKNHTHADLMPIEASVNTVVGGELPDFGAPLNIDVWVCALAKLASITRLNINTQ
jgi:hypothetical protein